MLVVDNAHKFNEDDSDVYEKATKLREFIRKEMESVLEVEKMIASSPHNTATRNRGTKTPAAVPPKKPESERKSEPKSNQKKRKKEEGEEEEDEPEDKRARRGKKDDTPKAPRGGRKKR